MVLRQMPILVVASLLLAPGCAGAGGPADSEPLATRRAATGQAAIATTSPVTAPSARVVAPVEVRDVGRDRVRTFNLRPGDSFATERGGVIKLSAVGKDVVVLDRTYPGWTIPARPAEHSIGNWEYIRIVDVNPEAGSLRLELRSITKKRPWEAFSF
jgi:hypothetical protein